MLIFIYFICALVCANIAFFLKYTHIIRIVLWLVFYACILYLGTLLERHNYGSIYNKSWDFYAITFFGYVILSYPAIVWRYLYHKS
jgi:Protein of unknown function (DUF2818)